MSAPIRSFARRARRPLLLVLAIAMLVPAIALAASGSPARARVRAVEIDDLGLTHPLGIAYSPARAQFFVLEPGTADGRTRVTTLTATDEHVASSEIPMAFAGAANVAFDDHDSRLLVIDGDGTLTAFDVLADGRIDASSMTRLEMPRVGPLRVAGITTDPASGDVYVLDRLSRRILRFTPAEGTPATFQWISLGRLASVDLRGLAWDAGSQRFSLVDSRAAVLYRMTARGILESARDLRDAGLDEPRTIVVAPSRDQTDDPATVSVFVAGPDAAGRAGLFEIPLVEDVAPGVSAVTATPTLVRSIDVSAWAIPSPDPSGLAWHAPSGRLLMVDGEVDEESYWKNVNYYELTLTGTYVRGADLSPFSIEAVGVTHNPLNGNIIVTDDDADEVFIIEPGPDGVVTATDPRRSFKSRNFGSIDPEGATFDAVNNKLYVTDSENSEVYELSPGPNGLFDAVDDVVRHFDTARLGATDPEGVEYHPTRGTLFAIGTGQSELIEMTVDGALVATYDLSFVVEDHPSGLAFAPCSTDPSRLSLYIVYRNQDNDSHSSENDGRLLEIALEGTAPPPPSGGSGPGPLAIRIAAGSDDAEESATGSMSVTGGDLELVLDSNLQVVGLRFPNVAVAPRAVIDSAFIQFKADESHSGATVLAIHGQAADNPATFTSTSRNVSLRPKTLASVSWSPAAWTAAAAGAAQRSPNLAPILQEIVDRPGWRSGNAIVLMFSGTGRRIAESYEGDRNGAPQLAIHVGVGTSSGPANRAPLVEAGANQSIAITAQAILDGTVTDDGLPAPPNLFVRWSRGVDAAPGNVIFTNDRLVDTQASFTAAGTYVLRLEASDGQLSTTDSLAIDVRIPGATPVTVESRIATGNDDAEQRLTGSMSLTSSDLELMTDGSALQRVGMRFTGLALPPGAVVTNAWIQFKVETATSDPTALVIQAEASNNAATFTTVSNNIGARTLTTASVPWTPVPWPTAKAVGPEQRTPNLSPLLNQLTALPGWSTTSPVVIIVNGTGKRIAESYEGDRLGAPLLHVEYLH